MGKKNKKKSKKSAKKSKQSAASSEVLQLINRVSDSEIEHGSFDIPSDEVMDDIGIPNPSIKGHSLQWFSDNLLIGVGEWGSAFSQVLRDEKLTVYDPDFDNFSKYSPEKQSEYRKRMIDIVRRNERISMYKKWKFARDKADREAYFKQWEDANFSDFSSVASGGGVEEVVEESQEVGGGSQGVGEEVGEGSRGVGEEQSMVIWQGSDDAYKALGYDPFPPPHPRFDASTIDDSTIFIDFPRCITTDVICLYQHPFSLASWYENHIADEARWLNDYKDWGGGKLRSECLGIVQGLISSWLNLCQGDKPHGKLNDMRNYIISQHVESHKGAKKVKFSVVLINWDHGATSFGDDVEEFIKVLSKIFEGGLLDSEMQQLPKMLRLTSVYPNGYVALVLKDFPGLWDAEERIAFFINLSFRFVSDVSMRTEYQDCFNAASAFGTRLPLPWQAKIPVGSVFERILHYIKYSDDDITHMVKYIRNTFIHLRDTPDGQQISLRRVEHILSEIFTELLLNIYTGMCIRNLFLS